jgi:hypothetical protein
MLKSSALGTDGTFRQSKKLLGVYGGSDRMGRSRRDLQKQAAAKLSTQDLIAMIKKDL